MPHESARRTKSPIGPRSRLKSSSEARWRWGGARDTSSAGRLAGHPAHREVYRSQALPAHLESARSADGFPGQGGAGVLVASLSWWPLGRIVGFPGLSTAESSGRALSPRPAKLPQRPLRRYPERRRSWRTLDETPCQSRSPAGMAMLDLGTLGWPGTAWPDARNQRSSGAWFGPRLGRPSCQRPGRPGGDGRRTDPRRKVCPRRRRGHRSDRRGNQQPDRGHTGADVRRRNDADVRLASPGGESRGASVRASTRADRDPPARAGERSPGRFDRRHPRRHTVRRVWTPHPHAVDGLRQARRRSGDHHDHPPLDPRPGRPH